MKYFRPILILYFLISGVWGTSAQTASYAAIFGKNWIQAQQLVEKHQDWMQKECSIFRVDFPLAVSMVFPELVRYSALRDRIEITLMKGLYVHKGAEYADFSVGIFQVKPSCAEAILGEIAYLKDRKLHRFFDHLHRSLTEQQKRVAILKELEDPEAEFIYVLGMIKILDNRYGKMSWKNREEKVRYYAAAYNSGFNGSETRIRQQMEAASFHTGLVKPEVCYSYASISAAFYNELTSKAGILD